MNKNYFYSIVTILLAAFLTAGIIWAWTEPGSAPPGGNVPAPLNTSINAQAKDGALVVGWGLTGAHTAFIVQHGKLDVADGQVHATGDICTDLGGPTGICLSTAGSGVTGGGTQNYIPLWTGSTPSTSLGNSLFQIYPGTELPEPYIDFANYKLGNIREIDPVFNVWGKKYTSYLPDMIGQKIEVIGEAQLGGDEMEIDLDSQAEGSDLWLFWQVVDQGSVISFVTPQDDASLYAYIDGSKFIIRLREGEQDAKFSYRLIGTRLDHADDIDNLYDDQTVEHYIDIDSLRK